MLFDQYIVSTNLLKHALIFFVCSFCYLFCSNKELTFGGFLVSHTKFPEYVNGFILYIIVECYKCLAFDMKLSDIKPC